MYKHRIHIAGTRIAASVSFNLRLSLFLLTLIVLLPGCGDNDAPHSHIDSAAAPASSTALATTPPSAVDSLKDTLPAVSAATTLPPTDSVTTSIRKPPAKVDSVSKKRVPPTPTVAKADVPTKQEATIKPVESAKDGKSAGSSACAEVTPDLIKQGRAIFMGKGFCQTCHGPDGKGNIQGPDLTDSKWVHISGDYPSISKIVRTGVSVVMDYRMPMPPMGGAKLSDDEVCAVAAYVWSLTH